MSRPPFPSLLSVAAANNSATTQRFAEVTASYLSALGYNLHLGPSLALAPELEGAAGSIHCLGSSPEFIADAGATILSVLKEEGILSVSMDFPGGSWNHHDNERRRPF